MNLSKGFRKSKKGKQYDLKCKVKEEEEEEEQVEQEEAATKKKKIIPSIAGMKRKLSVNFQQLQYGGVGGRGDGLPILLSSESPDESKNAKGSQEVKREISKKKKKKNEEEMVVEKEEDQSFVRLHGAPIRKGMALLGGNNSGRRATQTEIIKTYASQQRRPTLTQSCSSPELHVSKKCNPNNQNKLEVSMQSNNGGDGGDDGDAVLAKAFPSTTTTEVTSVGDRDDSEDDIGFSVVGGDPSSLNPIHDVMHITDTVLDSPPPTNHWEMGGKGGGGGGGGGGGVGETTPMLEPLEYTSWVSKHFKPNQNYRRSLNWHDHYMRSNRNLQDMLVIKIAILGRVSVGKTSLCRKFCDNSFVVNTTKPTIMFELRQAIISIEGIQCNLLIYDLAGNLGDPNFLEYAHGYVITCHCVILAYETSASNVDGEIGYWSQGHINKIVKDLKAQNIPLALVGTKLDLIENDKKAISRNLSLAKLFKSTIPELELIRFTSAKTGGYVIQFFTEVIQLSLVYQAKYKMCICLNCHKIVHSLLTKNYSQWGIYFRKYRDRMMQDSRNSRNRAKYNKKYFGKSDKKPQLSKGDHDDDDDDDQDDQAGWTSSTVSRATSQEKVNTNNSTANKGVEGAKAILGGYGMGEVGDSENTESDSSSSGSDSSSSNSSIFSDEDNDRIEETIGDFYDLVLFIYNSFSDLGCKEGSKLDSSVLLDEGNCYNWCCG